MVENMCFNWGTTASGFRGLTRGRFTQTYICVRFAPVQIPLRCGGKLETLDRRNAFKERV